MRKLTYILLLLFNIILVFSQQVNYNYQPQTYRQDGIGYSTKYGNSFALTQLSTQPVQFSQTAEQRLYGVQNTAPQYIQQASLRKAPGDSNSGLESATVDGHTVTVYWSVSAEYLGLLVYRITYEPGGTEFCYYGKSAAISQAKEHAKQLAQQLAEEAAHAMPIGDAILPTILITLAYIGYIEIKRRKKGKHFLCSEN